MKPRVLFIVTGDPRTSPRPAEAVRIAAGVAVWEKADVTVYLRGEAVRALGEVEEGLIDEENFAQYWPVLMEKTRGVYAQQSAESLSALGPPRVSFKEISDDDLAALTVEQTVVIRF